MSYFKDLDDFAQEIVLWHDTEWLSPDGSKANAERIIMKTLEELGELSGALVKHLQGRTDKAWDKEAEKEFGDVLITLCVLSSRMSRQPMEMLRRRWYDDVSKRKGASFKA